MDHVAWNDMIGMLVIHNDFDVCSVIERLSGTQNMIVSPGGDIGLKGLIKEHRIQFIHWYCYYHNGNK